MASPSFSAYLKTIKPADANAGAVAQELREQRDDVIGGQ